MAKRSVALYLRLFAICCAQIGIQFASSAIFGLSGPLFSDRFKLSSTAVNIIFSVIGPVVGFFVQPIFGAISDNCTFRFGRRRIFIVSGGILTIIGMIIIASATFIDDAVASALSDSSSSSEDNAVNHLVGTSLGMIGIFVGFFGTNVTQGPARAIISDIVDVENQQDANLMLNACSGGSSVACFAISAFTVGSDDTFLIMFLISAIVVFFSNIPTVIFSKETKYVLEEGQTKSVLQPFINLFKAIKMINFDISVILLALMFGWFAYQPFTTNFTNYVGYTIYNGDHDEEYNDGLQMAFFILCVFATVQCLSVFIFPVISDVIGEVSTFLVFQLLGGVGYVLLCTVDFTFPSDRHDPNQKPQYITSLLLSFLSVCYPAMAFSQTNSLPYSMLKKVVPPSRFGVFVGLLNCSLVLAQFLASGCTALIQLIYDEYLVPMIVSAVFSVFAAGITVILYRVEKKTKDPLLATSVGEENVLLD